MVFEEAIKVPDPTSCAITLEDFEEGKSIINKLPCNHWFMADALNKHSLTQVVGRDGHSSRCPLCREIYCPSEVNFEVYKKNCNDCGASTSM